LIVASAFDRSFADQAAFAVKGRMAAASAKGFALVPQQASVAWNGISGYGKNAETLYLEIFGHACLLRDRRRRHRMGGSNSSITIAEKPSPSYTSYPGFKVIHSPARGVPGFPSFGYEHHPGKNIYTVEDFKRLAFVMVGLINRLVTRVY
jgi:hypothetical protein